MLQWLMGKGEYTLILKQIPVCRKSLQWHQEEEKNNYLGGIVVVK